MFEKGRLYKRSELHDQFGGNRQGGIANCSSHPYIFVFTGKAGEQHGYADGWDTDNYFHYTGEGQSGDMTFTKGNKALLSHQANDKEVFLFENNIKGHWRYIDQLELVDYRFFPTPDSSGKLRNGIQLKFRPASETSGDTGILSRSASNYNKPSKTARQGLVTSRVGQGWYRRFLLEKWDHRCAVTGLDTTDILIASHIVPWKNATDHERLDPENGILLAPNLDALFDRHLVSFEEDGSIILSNKLSESQYSILGINKGLRLREVTAGMRKYLQLHRDQLSKVMTN